MRSRPAGQWPAGVSAAVLRQSCFSRKPQSPLVRSLTAALRPGAAPGVTARGGRWPVPGCCHGNTEISAGFSNWGCSQAKLTHATNRHTVCDIHQCRSSKATESRFQWRPDHLWGARCGQEARGGATPGRAVLGFVQSYQEEFTGTPVPLFPQIQMSRVREKLRNVAAGELALGRPCTQDRDGHGAATLGSPLPRARGRHPRLRRCACPSA